MSTDTVCFVQSKGGVSKTVSAMALCYAAGMRYFDEHYDYATYCLTDSRNQLDDEMRPYEIFAAKSDSEFDDFISKAKAASGNNLIVIDGAGGNPQADQRFSRLSDLVLIPMTPNEEAMDCAMSYLEMPNSYVLPSIWSTNKFAADTDADYITRIVDRFGAHRVLPPMINTHSVNVFVRPDFRCENLQDRAVKFSKLLLGTVITLLERQRSAQQ